MASVGLVERHNAPWEQLLLLNMLFLAHLCHRLSLYYLLQASFWLSAGLKQAPTPGAYRRIFKAYPIFKTWESKDMITNLTTVKYFNPKKAQSGCGCITTCGICPKTSLIWWFRGLGRVMWPGGVSFKQMWSRLKRSWAKVQPQGQFSSPAISQCVTVFFFFF